MEIPAAEEPRPGSSPGDPSARAPGGMPESPATSQTSTSRSGSKRSKLSKIQNGRVELPPAADGSIRYAQGGLIWTDPKRFSGYGELADAMVDETSDEGSTLGSDNHAPGRNNRDPGAEGWYVPKESDGSAASAESSWIWGTPDASDTSAPADERPHAFDEDTPVWSAKMAAYELPQSLLDAALENERVAARAHASRARNIEAARVASVQVEENFPREEATARTKTRGWTAKVIAERGFVAMVSAKLRISGRDAQYLVDTSQTLHAFFEPTLQLLETGNTSYRHANIVVEQSAGVPLEYHSAYESELLPYAITLTPAQFRRKARAIAAKFIKDQLEERHREALVHREMVLTPAEDGMADLHLYIDAVAATAILNRASDAATALKTKDEERTLTQLRVDVAAELLLTGISCTPGTPMVDALNLRSFDRFSAANDTATAGKTGTLLWEEEFGGREGPVLGSQVIATGLGAGFTAQVSVHVPALTLLEKGTEPATLDQYGPISLETAKLIMGSVTSFTRALTDPDTGAVLSVGTTRYKVPLAMRLWLLFRDGTCRFPGCTQPARACDMDHTLDWQYGGETAAANLMCLCRAHHNVKHHTDWRPALDPDGTAFWISPTGERFTTAPAHYLKAA
jgi:hypothetical protein